MAGTTPRSPSVVFTVSDYFDGIEALDGPPAEGTTTPNTVDAHCSVTTSAPLTVSGHPVASTNVSATTSADDVALVSAVYTTTAVALVVTVDTSGDATQQGQFDVTITCEDEEVSVFDSATITVR